MKSRSLSVLEHACIASLKIPFGVQCGEPVLEVVIHSRSIEGEGVECAGKRIMRVPSPQVYIAREDWSRRDGIIGSRLVTSLVVRQGADEASD